MVLNKIILKDLQVNFLSNNVRSSFFYPFQKVGYKVRLEGMKGKDTRLLFCTTGILLRRLLVDRNLKGVTHVIVDEIHERGMNEGTYLFVGSITFRMIKRYYF